MVAAAQQPQPTVAPTPPMGWNSWDAYGLTITEPQFRANVDVLRDKLLPFGWNYAVIDEGWFFENPSDRPTPDKLRYAIDPYGRYVPVPARFPSAVVPGSPSPQISPSDATHKLSATIESTSFATLGEWVHSQGLKFGIHIVRGIPRAAVERNLPIQGSDFHAQDAADQTDACPWDPTNWGVRDNAAGQAWYDSLLRQYASWGVDLLKVDCIADHPFKLDEIEMIHRAIQKTGRPIVLSLSPGPTALAHAAEVTRLANMWRIADDEWDVWSAAPGKTFPQGVKDQFARLAAWAPYARARQLARRRHASHRPIASRARLGPASRLASHPRRTAHRAHPVVHRAQPTHPRRQSHPARRTHPGAPHQSRPDCHQSDRDEELRAPPPGRLHRLAGRSSRPQDRARPLQHRRRPYESETQLRTS